MTKSRLERRKLRVMTKKLKRHQKRSGAPIHSTLRGALTGNLRAPFTLSNTGSAAPDAVEAPSTIQSNDGNSELGHNHVLHQDDNMENDSEPPQLGPIVLEMLEQFETMVCIFGDDDIVVVGRDEYGNPIDLSNVDGEEELFILPDADLIPTAINGQAAVALQQPEDEPASVADEQPEDQPADVAIDFDMVMSAGVLLYADNALGELYWNVIGTERMDILAMTTVLWNGSELTDILSEALDGTYYEQ